MKTASIKKRLLKDNSYLMVSSVLLLLISLFTGRNGEAHDEKKYASALQHDVHQAEDEFRQFAGNTGLVTSFAAGTESSLDVEKAAGLKQFIFLYGDTTGPDGLRFWNTQAVQPTDDLLRSADSIGFISEPNGYYVFQKLKLNDLLIVSLLPVKWNYVITNDYLHNDFEHAPKKGKQFSIGASRSGSPVFSAAGKYLFSIKAAGRPAGEGQGRLTVFLRLISLLPLMLFIHFTAARIYARRGLAPATIFLATTLILLRVISYFFPFPVALRQFELFDPAIYGSGIILRSLGDLLINAVLFFWVINFIKDHLHTKTLKPLSAAPALKWLLSIVGVLIIIGVTYTATGIIRSMVADSQISFDVIDFFSLDIYSVIGFLVLCCIAIGYYYFCRVMLFFLKALFPGLMLPFFISVAALGLLVLNFRIGKMTGSFDLWILCWLLVFLFIVKSELAGFFSGSFFISKNIFWLFFFSASVATVIIAENTQKELRNRLHYAELLATKTDPISEVLLSSMLTEFRPGMLTENFGLLTAPATAGGFRDSIVNNNFSGYTDNYDTKVLVYDSTEMPLANRDAVSFNSINSILNTQARPSSVPGLFLYDAGYDKFSYLAEKILRDRDGRLLGYLFIVISPHNVENDMLYPELFNHDRKNSLENSAEYAYAIYEKGKLVSSHNDYAFSSRYTEKHFNGRAYLVNDNRNYSELWYDAGNGKYILIVKESSFFTAIITLFSYLFCAFLLLSAFSALLSLILRSRFRPARIKNEIRFSIRQQVHGTVIFFSVVSFIIIGIATILFFISRYEKNDRETLSRTIRVMENDLSGTLTADEVRQTNFRESQSAATSPVAAMISRLSEVHGPDVNLYSPAGDLKASSLALPYIRGIVSTKMDPVAFYHLTSKGDVRYLQREHIGDLSFVSDYIPVTDSSGRQIAFLNIPYFTSQSRLREEISGFLVTIINLNAFIFLIAGIVALMITNRITRSFTFISEQMKKINLGKVNEAIAWRRDDEIGALVQEYNRMLAKLDQSAAALARSERDSAWQEMARQVAHEIKNPLTPMKLSMQFLQKSIENNSPDIKELGARVSATLVEQIDHLSTIAGEFSRFADIENAKPEIFNINEALRSLKQLYENDEDHIFEWNPAPDPVIINADRTHINRILTNLIVNGLQAVPPERVPHITVSESVRPGSVIIEIRDNGSGISEEAGRKIFTPNFTTKSSGTGLGLAMCRRMIEQAGGEISYETSAAGTAFFIKLNTWKEPRD